MILTVAECQRVPLRALHHQVHVHRLQGLGELELHPHVLAGGPDHTGPAEHVAVTVHEVGHGRHAGDGGHGAAVAEPGAGVQGLLGVVSVVNLTVLN